MKSKIVVFKALAAIIAVVGAIASVSANSAFIASTAYVHYATQANTYCVRVGTCDRPGQFNCVVQVTIAGNVTNYNAKRALCNVTQTDTDSGADASTTLPPDAILIP